MSECKTYHARLLAILRMTRPLQLVAVSAVFLLGAGFALATGARPSVETLGVGWLVLLPLAASIHLINEYADFEVDAHAQRTPFSGGSGALADSGLDRNIAAIAAGSALLVGLAATMVAYLAGFLTETALFLLAIGIVLGWMYSIGPLALAWRGWGEFDNAFAGGLVLPLYGLIVAGGRLSWDSMIVWLPFVGLVFLNLLATTWADRGVDYQFGKRTLATRWQPSTLRWLYMLVLAATIFVWVWLGLSGEISRVAFWLGALALSLSWWAWRLYTRQENPLPSVAAMGAFVVFQFAALSLQIVSF